MLIFIKYNLSSSHSHESEFFILTYVCILIIFNSPNTILLRNKLYFKTISATQILLRWYHLNWVAQYTFIWKVMTFYSFEVITYKWSLTILKWLFRKMSLFVWTCLMMRRSHIKRAESIIKFKLLFIIFFTI